MNFFQNKANATQRARVAQEGNIEIKKKVANPELRKKQGALFDLMFKNIEQRNNYLKKISERLNAEKDFLRELMKRNPEKAERIRDEYKKKTLDFASIGKDLVKYIELQEKFIDIFESEHITEEQINEMKEINRKENEAIEKRLEEFPKDIIKRKVVLKQLIEDIRIGKI